MADKKSTPAPIDRPLSRAYLREFSGWSTAFAPGLSAPTSLRIMENCWITRSGALQIRPALRSVFPDGNWITTNFNARIIGSFESFFLNDGTKALLFATKETSGVVSFKVAAYNDVTAQYEVMSLGEAGFTGTTTFSSSTTYVRYLQIDNKIFALPDSTSAADTVRIFNVGETKKVVTPKEITSPSWGAGDALTVRLPDAAWINSASKTTIPAAESPLLSGTANQPLTGTLIDLDAADNTFNFGYFYTFQNDLGETPPSQLTVIKAKRGWSQWQFQSAAAAGGPSGTNVSDPLMACDQIVAIVPTAAWNDAIADGATGWNLYMITWSDQGAVPVEGTLIASKDMTVPGITQAKDSWLQHTPVAASYDVVAPLPTPDDRTNYSKPSSASQGLVAGDRITLVNDRQAAAVIRWSSNQLGEYTNFSPNKGGGYKTLTSGNLLVPACVKLWQNPQSTDTLVVLCRGVDGYSTSYYMAPATVSGQTGSTAVMGFEETTATPGTVSPWGCEVVNQALYHPLDEQLMKSTASNYNINHKTMTEQISNVWLELVQKQNIVSASMDSRLYYIVNNPDGEPLEAGCMGNEIWVCDTGAGTDVTWSRWLIQANSLHRLDVDDKLYMAVVRPDAIFVLDELETMDAYSDDGDTNHRAIPWKIETNTQGANRAHDAWCHLQQLSITMGNFIGRMRYGLRGWDLHGKQVEISKITKDLRPVDLKARVLPWDIEDFLLIRRDLKEWSLFAESVEDDEGSTMLSYGRINLVQYRYAPVSVNVGYEYGSVETFEYSRASSHSDAATVYPNGVPLPYVDTSR